MKDIWRLVDNLEQSFPLSQRPSALELLTSLGDQRKPIQQNISKTALELKIAETSCQYLEEQYRKRLQ